MGQATRPMNSKVSLFDRLARWYRRHQGGRRFIKAFGLWDLGYGWCELYYPRNKYAVGAFGLVLAVALLVAMGGSATAAPFSKFIDAGNTGSAITFGHRTWAPQSGFTGGAPATVSNLRSTDGLPSSVANTVISGPTAFATSVPTGSFNATVWVVVPSKGNVLISAEGKPKVVVRAHSNIKPQLRGETIPVSVSDGTLNLQFTTSGQPVQVAAVAITGWVRTSTTSGGAPSATTTTPTTSKQSVGDSSGGTTTSTSTTVKAVSTSTTAVQTVASTIPPVRNDASEDDNRGEWQMMCDASHFAPDDPIVFPGVPGVSHMHEFYGNVSTDASSTLSTMQAAGKSSCGRGMDTSDLSGYWVPALYKQNADGTSSLVTGGDQIIWAYYRRPGGPTGPKLQPFPPGLKMIAGDSKATSPQPSTIVHWDCRQGPTYPGVPDCSSGGEMHAKILFPSCWNGKDLDSPNHRSHMAYANLDGTCPPGYPVSLPELWLEPDYLGVPAGKYTLASGGIYSMHADFFADWNSHVQNALIANCLNDAHVCEDINKNGNQLFKPAGDEGAPFPPIDITKY